MSAARPERQYLYFCTGKASKLRAGACQECALAKQLPLLQCTDIRGFVRYAYVELHAQRTAQDLSSIRQHTSAYVSIRQRIHTERAARDQKGRRQILPLLYHDRPSVNRRVFATLDKLLQVLCGKPHKGFCLPPIL
jgi:hypothetical protein